MKLINYFIRGVLPLVIVSGVMISSSAQASLIFEGLITGGGAGIGALNVILTIQNLGVESGAVGWNGTTDVLGISPTASVPGGTPISPAIPGGNEITGNSQTQTVSVATAGITSADTLFVIFNALQASGGPITLENLSLTIYSPGGAILFNSGNVTPDPQLTFTQSDVGQGNLGFGFFLDPTQIAQANNFIICDTCGANRIGLAALVSSANGGNETFSIINIVPEPPTLLTLVGGLIALLCGGSRLNFLQPESRRDQAKISPDRRY